MKRRYFKSKSSPPTPTFSLQGSPIKWLIIVESSSKCHKIESFLGEQYKCIASNGHLRELKGLKSINIKQNYKLSFTVSPTKQKHIENMGKIICQFPSENIILATDDDREGEAIAWHICEIFQLPIQTTPRIIFHEITKNAVLNAISNPKLIDMNIVYAQQTRQILDIFIGFKVSPILWKYIPHAKENALSAGRCQTPALRLVYDNEMEKMAKGDVETHYIITGNFFDLKIDFVLNHKFENGEQIIEFLQKSINHKYEYSLSSPREHFKFAPQPFNTSTLLQSVSSSLGYSPSETMKLCQTLYQSGHITYMRTESRKYSKEFTEETSKFIEKTYGKENIGNNTNITNYDNLMPHEAIRVTKIHQRELTDEKGKSASLYRHIWINTIQSCMQNSRYKCTDILLTSPHIDDRLIPCFYKHTVEIPLFLGWQNCGKGTGEKKTNQQNNSHKLLTQIQYIKNIICNKITSDISFHNVHNYYTEAGLIQKLEQLGIGRPSTFALFIETIQQRGYIKKMDLEGHSHDFENWILENNQISPINKTYKIGNVKNKLIIQPSGKLIVEFLNKFIEELFNYSFTKQLEEKLDIIATTDNSNWQELCNECNSTILRLTKPILKIFKEKIHLDENHSFVFTKNGPAILLNIENTDENNDETADENEKPKNKYLSIQKNLLIDYDKIKNGNYTIDDLVEISVRFLGKWEEQDIFLKRGKFGNYLEWGENTKNCNDYKTFEEITIDDIEEILKKQSKTVEKHLVRVLTPDLSIRRGKYGPYIFYKTPNMKTPKFFSLKGFSSKTQSFYLCDIEIILKWIGEQYNV